MPSTRARLLDDLEFVALGRRILSGSCSLFIGAGASLDSGAPNTPALADMLAETVLMTDERAMSLGDVVDYIDGSVGRRAATQAISAQLRTLTPSANLVRLARLPWKSVYSTNFDTLMEQAYDVAWPGQSQAVTSAKDLENIRPNLIPLYYLHGCITQPNDPAMGLVLTQRDMARSAFQRQAFYRRLTDDIAGGEVIYIGFSLRDQDFRAVVTDLHDSVDNRQEFIPRGYAVIPHPPAFAAGYWDGQKISFIAATLGDFVEALEQLREGVAGVPAIPVGIAPLLPEFLRSISPASSTAFGIAHAFDFPEFDDGAPEPTTFLRGAPPTWATIRDKYDAQRDIADAILDWLVVPSRDEPLVPRRSSTQVGLLSGYAGAGKSTLSRRLAWSLRHDWSQPVVWARHPSRLEFDMIETVASFANGRLYVFLDDSADSAFQVAQVIERSRRRGLRVTFVVIDRANEWVAASRDHPVEVDRTFTLSKLSDSEAEGVLATLERAGELGALASRPPDERIHVLVSRAGRDLLVGLREATEENRRFDEILEDEYSHLPSESARRAYATVCTLFQFGVAARAGVLSRTTGVPFDKFGDAILGPSRGVILEAQDQPWEQPRYIARHRVIADVVFRRAYPTSTDRAVQVQSLLQNLDPGYRDDSRAFAKLINARWLRERGVADEGLDAIYALARRLRPGDPFVVQQEGLAWRRRDRLYAARLLREAEAAAPNSEAIKHSQAVLLLDDAKEASGEERTQLLGKAEEALRTLRNREPQNAAPYVSLARIELTRAEDSKEAVDKLAHIAAASRIVTDAFRRSPASSYLFEISARVEEAAGRLEKAGDAYLAAARGAGPEPHVWISYSRFLLTQDGPKAAAAALEEALDLNPVDPQLNHEYARILERLKPLNDAAIRKAYGVAIAEPVRGHLPGLDFAIYLHRNGSVAEAEGHFQVLRASDLPSRIKSAPRHWLEENGRRRQFAARVVDVRHTRSFLEVLDVEGRVFIHSRDLTDDERRVGATVNVWIHYNCFGTRAVPARLGQTANECEDDPDANEFTAERSAEGGRELKLTD